MCVCVCVHALITELQYISSGFYKSALRHKNLVEREQRRTCFSINKVPLMQIYPTLTFFSYSSLFPSPSPHVTHTISTIVCSPMRALPVYLPLTCTLSFYIYLHAVPLFETQVRTDLISDWLIELQRPSPLTHVHTHRNARWMALQGTQTVLVWNRDRQLIMTQTTHGDTAGLSSIDKILADCKAGWLAWWLFGRLMLWLVDW